MKRVRKLAFVLALIALFCTPALVLGGEHKVLRVVDGDTIVVDYQGKKEKIRMLCVNTPESVHPGPRRNTPMGKKASINDQ